MKNIETYCPLLDFWYSGLTKNIVSLYHLEERCYSSRWNNSRIPHKACFLVIIWLNIKKQN